MKSIQLYAIIALLLIVLGGGFYTNHLRNKVQNQSVEITELKATEASLRKAQLVLEATIASRDQTRTKIEVIKRDVQNAQDADLPAPIERAFDGLRNLQAR